MHSIAHHAEDQARATHRDSHEAGLGHVCYRPVRNVDRARVRRERLSVSAPCLVAYGKGIKRLTDVQHHRIGMEDYDGIN